MNDPRIPATSGMKAVALLIAWVSVAQLRPGAPFNLPDTAYGTVVFTASIAGLVAAISIWINASWMIIAYGGWLSLMIVARVWHDSRLEAPAWEVALGGVVLAALLGTVGYFLYRDQKQVAANLAPYGSV